jgi:D-serine deaminase-like pyridoxal phosphate-dependent protein
MTPRTVDALPTPALLVDLDRFEANVGAAAGMVRGTGTHLRPHAKTHRTPGLALRQLGPEAPGVTCATVGEAEVMVDAGVTDVLVANELVVPAQLERVAVLARTARVSVAVDSWGGLEAMSAAAGSAETTLGAVVDVDVGLGRCGVADAGAARALSLAVVAERHLRFDGLMGYEGRFADPAGPRDRVSAAYALLAEAKAGVEDGGIAVELVTSAGTSTLRDAVADPVVTEVQAGTYAFMEPDLAVLDLPFRPALRVEAVVVSRAPGRVVLAAGKKSFSCDRGLPVVDAARQVIAVNEEHTLLEWEGSLPALGSRVTIVPSHVPLTFNLHDAVWLCRGDEVVDRLPIAARGRST